MLTRAFRIIVLVAACWGWAGAGVAQTPSPEARAAARELTAVLRTSDQFKAILPLVMQAMKPAVAQGRPAVERDFDIIARELMADMNSQVADVVELIAGIYAVNFTVDEMRALIAFYGTPLGQKLLEKTPVIAQQGMQAGQTLGKSLVERARPRMIEELRKRGHNI